MPDRYGVPEQDVAHYTSHRTRNPGSYQGLVHPTCDG
jgi:hypothetical protein